MSDPISLTINYERGLWRQAMTGWWRSVIPPEPFMKRAIIWAVIWGGVGALALGLSALGFTPNYVIAGIIGAGFIVGGIAFLQRTRMSRFWDIVGGHWDKAGECRAQFGPDGIILSDAVSYREMSWEGVDAIKDQNGVTVIRSGISMIAVPDKDLPEGMSSHAFQDKLHSWQGKAA